MTAIKVETQPLEDRQIRLTVEVSAERIQAAMQAAARRLSQKTRIAGFRPGRAPYDIILRKFGEQEVFDEALDHLGKEVYREALEDCQVDAYAPGSLEEVVSRDPLVIRYTVPLAPEIDLGNYRELRLPIESPEVSDAALEEFLEELRQRQALIEEVQRPAQLSDVVVLDVRGELQDSEPGQKSTLLDEHGVSVLVDEATDWPIPGVCGHLIGLSASEEKEFGHVFAPDYRNESLRGRSATFHVKVHKVNSRFVPAWSDDLARSAGDFDDLLDLRVKARKHLQEAAQKRAEAEYAQKVLDAVTQGATVSYPPVLLEQELDEMVGDLARRLEAQKLSLEDYLKIEAKTAQDLRNELEPSARERLKRALVLGKVVEAETLEVENEEVLAQVERLSAPWKDPEKVKKVLDNPVGRRRIALDLLTEKSVQRLTAIAKGEAGQEAQTLPGPPSKEAPTITE